MTTTSIIDKTTDWVLITGASGFVGAGVIESLLRHGFKKIRCFTRLSSKLESINELSRRYRNQAEIEVVTGNLLSREDCANAVRDVTVIYHLAATSGEKSVPHAFLNSVVTTRNLIEASLQGGCLRRFVNMSSFAVYTNRDKQKGRLLDESCPIEDNPALRGDAYSFAKIKQDEIVVEYGQTRELPYVILRPGVVYGPGKTAISGRVGIDTFGVFLHLGGSNRIPLTYIDNCADAIVLAGIIPGLEREVFNIVDDELPSSRNFLYLYKKNVRKFRSVFLPKWVTYLLCYCWEMFSDRSHGQLPRAYNRKVWHYYWKSTTYANEKIKERIGWKPKVSTSEGMQRFFTACKVSTQSSN